MTGQLDVVLLRLAFLSPIMRAAVLAVAAVLVLVVLAMIQHRRRQKDIPKIPLAPRTLPVIGNVNALKAILNHTFHRLLAEYAEVAGERGVLRLCVAGSTALIVTTPAAFAAVLHKTGFVPKPPAIYSGALMFGIKRHSLFTTLDGAEHDRLRRVMARCFNADTVAQATARLAASVDAAVTAAATAATAGPGAVAAADAGALEESLGVYRGDISKDGVLVNATRFCSHNIIAAFKVFMGVDLQPPLAALEDTLSHASATSAHPAQFQLLKRGLYPGFRRYRRNWNALYGFHCEVVQQIFSRPPPADTRTLWAALRACFPDAMSDAAQFEGAVANVSFMYVAGFETTSNAAMHTLSALALDQPSQALLVEELREAGLLATAEQPHPPPVAAQVLLTLKMLDAVCHESLRLMAPLQGSARKLTRDTKIGGYTVPKGTDVLLAIGALHTGCAAWGADASCWRPQRWLEGRSKASVKKDADGHLCFLPFLDGGTNCIGQHLALTELKMVVAAVVSRLHVALDPQRLGHLRTVEDYAGENIFLVTLQRATPAWLRMRPRVPP